MSPIYEKVKTEIGLLPDNEQYGLYAELRRRFEPEIQEAADVVAVGPAWRMEIDSRLMDVANGSAELVPGQEADVEVDAVFARHGTARLRQAA